MNIIGRTRSCRNCFDFEISPTRNQHLLPSLHADYPPGVANLNSPVPPDHLPIHKDRQVLNSFRQKISDMRQVVKVALFNVVSDDGWKMKHFDQYLHDAGINGHVQRKAKEMYYSLQSLPEHERIEALKLYGYDEVMPKMWKFDDIIDIDDNLDPIMHLVFEGVVKVLINEVIILCIEVMGLKRECLPQIQQTLIEIQQMSVEWLSPERLTKLKGKTVGWKGTDYVGASRIMKVLISHIKETIIEEGGPDLENNLYGYSILEKFVCFAQGMVARIMCDSCTEDEIQELEVYIKLFLSWSLKYCVEVEGKVGKETFTASKGNFLSLLNLPRQMRRFGPMRRYWDGDYEKFIGYVKEILPGGINRDGASSLVAKLRRFKETVAINASKNEAMKYLEKKGLLTESKEYTRYKDVHVYKSRREVEDKLREMKPISGVMVQPQNGGAEYLQVAYRVHGLKRNQQGFVFDQSNSGITKQAINCVSVIFDDSLGKWIAGSYYASPKIVNNRSYEDSHITVETLIEDSSRYACMIQKIEVQKKRIHWTNQMCTVVAHDWTERIENGLFETPSIHRSVLQ